MPQVLITGANGFIGKHLLNGLYGHSHWHAIAASRTGMPTLGVETRIIHSESPYEIYQKAVIGCDVIVHTAARAHILNETAEDPAALYRKINVAMTGNLARAAIEAGVKRFIFISSAGIYGRESQSPFTELDAPAPDTDYTRSKLEAEQVLLEIASGSGMDVTILRLPLVYGPEVRGNFLAMLKMLDRPLPLPLGSIQARRSLLFVENLVDFIVRSLDHPGAANEIFLLADNETVATSELLRMINANLGSKAWIFPFPLGLLKILATVINQQAKLEKLTASFEVDSSKAQRLLNWHAPVSLSSGIDATTSAYQINKYGKRTHD